MATVSVEAQRSPHPATTVKAAVEWARGRGLRVRLVEEFGVVAISQHADERWELDPRAEGVSPIGCCVLQEQPRCSDPDEAASLALDAPASYVTGLARGIAKGQPSAEWTEAVDRRLFMAGYEAGLFVRSWLMRPRTGDLSR
jgi:hypothetical protein